jgi:hypothetical protein
MHTGCFYSVCGVYEAESEVTRDEERDKGLGTRDEKKNPFRDCLTVDRVIK